MRSGVLLGFYEAANVRKPVRPDFSTGTSEKTGQTCFLRFENTKTARRMDGRLSCSCLDGNLSG